MSVVKSAFEELRFTLYVIMVTKPYGMLMK